jgi:hypothetical protein
MQSLSRCVCGRCEELLPSSKSGHGAQGGDVGRGERRWPSLERIRKTTESNTAEIGFSKFITPGRQLSHAYTRNPYLHPFHVIHPPLRGGIHQILVCNARLPAPLVRPLVPMSSRRTIQLQNAMVSNIIMRVPASRS